VSDRGYVAVLVVDLHFPEAGSLKAKRKDLQSLKALLQGRFGAAVSEVAFQDLWQRARLLVCLAGGSAQILSERVESVQRFIDSRSPAGAGIQRMLASVADLNDVLSTAERGR
jgi:uncharacterized protein YlxP (DUF503 family)